MHSKPPHFPSLLIAVCILAVGIFLLAVACGPDQDSKSRLVLIGLDGGSWNVIEPMMEAGELPRLTSIRERGLWGDLNTVEPLISPTVWTSIATGRRPEVHGVTSFFASRRQIRVPTIWERLAAGGLRVGLFDYLITWPPRDLPGGFMVPGWLRLDDSVSPLDLWRRLGTAPYTYEAVDVGGPAEVIANLEREAAEKPRAWNRLWREFALDVGAVTFYGADVASHKFYHTAFPGEVEAPIETDPRFNAAVFQTMRGLDAAIGEIVAELDADDHVVLVSDHGFQASPRAVRNWGFDPGWFLDRVGITPHGDGFVLVNGFMFMVVNVEPGPEEERDRALEQLTKLVASVSTTEGEPIFNVEVIRDPLTALESGNLEERMADVVRYHLPSHAVLFADSRSEVLDRLWPAGFVDVGGERVALADFAAPHVFSGIHHPVGIFLAAGKAIRRRPDRIRLSVLDVAPLLTYLADQPLPDDLEGTLDETWIEPEYLEHHPLRTVPRAEAPRLPPEDPDVSGQDHEELRQRLRALGYIQ